jgi:hypothetical protein
LEGQETFFFCNLKNISANYQLLLCVYNEGLKMNKNDAVRDFIFAAAKENGYKFVSKKPDRLVFKHQASGKEACILSPELLNLKTVSVSVQRAFRR